jgi:hypothetical protein
MSLESVPLTEEFLHISEVWKSSQVMFRTAGKENTQYKRKHNRSMNRFMRR